ncbi:hypothetical protein BDR07DRAFT_1389023 [Suillus spraguei]|nr:hypothetical protein BDR07DRAFT_1389023 [Suillus spraguei]
MAVTADTDVEWKNIIRTTTSPVQVTGSDRLRGRNTDMIKFTSNSQTHSCSQLFSPKDKRVHSA